MLNTSSVVISTNLSEVLVKEGISIVPKQGTLLNELSSAIFNNIFSEINNKDIIPDTIVNASLGKEITVKNIKSYNISTHDALMDNYIEDLKNIISNHISFARNVVNKEITSLREKVENSLQNYRYKDPEDFFNVTYYTLPEVFTSYLVTEEINNYSSGGKFFFEKLNLNSVLSNEFNLLEYILTGNEEEDKVIKDWYNNLTNEKAINYILNNIPEYSLSVPKLLDYSLINYLFYRNLTIKADINTGDSSVTLKSKAAVNRDYFGFKVYNAIESYKREIRNDIILTTDSDTNFSYLNENNLNITIYEENFNKAAKEGVSIEVLFGYIASLGNTNVTVKQLIENKDKYISTWNNTRSLYLLYLNNNKINIFKQILRTEFENSLNNLTDSEKEIHNGNNNKVIAIKKEVNNYIDKLHLDDIEDLETICLDIVAGIRFGFSNAYYILKEIKSILSLNENMEPIEAALLASIKYITDYLLNQIEVVKS